MTSSLRRMGWTGRIGWTVLAAATVMASAALPISAQAVPTDCTYSISGRDVIGTCASGTGQFRIRLDCRYAPDRYSRWASPGTQVSVKCLAGMPNAIIWETH